ncbi:MAG: aspartate aminotransferase family protein [Candidatus Latescibacterota bacterium]|nr:aspartate aminotransferase family protein [Candidatus Latescibacterota bacterium]
MPNDDLEARYRQASPRSRELFEQGRGHTAGAAKGAYFYPPYPLTMARGEGCHLWDVDGRCYLDFANHHTAQVLGHGHPAVQKAVDEQMRKGIALGAPTGIESEIAREMCRRVDALERIRFVNSGTEATLHAIRLARGYSQKGKIAKFEGGYHGNHDAVEVSVAPALDQAGPAAAPFSVPTAGGIAPAAASEALILPYADEEAVEKLVAAHADELACVLFDPKCGIIETRPVFARAVRDITRRHGVLLIFDEIVSFRTDVGGLQKVYGIDPDLSCFGKVVGGGFPVGAFGGRADLMDLFDNSQGPTDFFQSGTFSAHPVAMAAGLATLNELTPETISHLNHLGARLKEGLNALFAERAIPAQAVCTGSVFSIHFAAGPLANYRDLATTDKEPLYPLFLSLVEQGYFLGHPGLGMCALSTPMDDGHIDGLVAAVEEALAVER